MLTIQIFFRVIHIPRFSEDQYLEDSLREHGWLSANFNEDDNFGHMYLYEILYNVCV